jgi:hypothetical protein
VRAALTGAAPLAEVDPYDALADHFAAALDLRQLDALIGLG